MMLEVSHVCRLAYDEHNYPSTLTTYLPYLVYVFVWGKGNPDQEIISRP